jgi:prolyl-tRNA synthetase
MKDAYSFHATQSCLDATYERVCHAYRGALAELLPPNSWVQARGSSGAMGGSVSHEWLVKSPEGEDTVVQCGGCETHYNEELGKCPVCASDAKKGEASKAVEVGHTFFLGTRYSEPMQLLHGERKEPYLMGCYGLGITRLVSVTLTAWGMRWPVHLAPYAAVVVPHKQADPALLEQTLQRATANGTREVLLWDDAETTRSTMHQRVQKAALLRPPFLVQVTPKAVLDENGEPFDLSKFDNQHQ